MSVAPKLMDVDEFLEWALDREGVWELVDGVAVPKHRQEPQMLAGARQEHVIVVTNMLTRLKMALRQRCRVFSEAIGTRVHDHRLRRPDVTVDGGPKRQGTGETKTPNVIIEVLSPSTRAVDTIRKPFEYRSLPTLQHLLLLEPSVAAGNFGRGMWTIDGATRP